MADSSQDLETIIPHMTTVPIVSLSNIKQLFWVGR